MKKRQFKLEVVRSAIQEYVDGQASQRTIAEQVGISLASFQAWISKYQSMGIAAFTRNSNKCYSKELKEQAVMDYLAGRGSLQNICKTYKIMSKTQLRRWILKYNGYEELKASGTGGAIIMTQGRKTTFEERVEIVQYCIAHDHNYRETAVKYGVSYQQARNYTVKYEAGGIEALQDRRGRTKKEAEMTEVEKLRAENRILRAEKERAEMEASFLKNSAK